MENNTKMFENNSFVIKWSRNTIAPIHVREGRGWKLLQLSRQKLRMFCLDLGRG